jgi:hypothetical protein
LPDENESLHKKIDWRFEMRIPGGGFCERLNQYDFLAPEQEYQESVIYEYSSSMSSDDWKRTRKGRFFVKFADGTFGRIALDIDSMSSSRPLLLLGWHNPKSGSRNLAALGSTEQ